MPRSLRRSVPTSARAARRSCRWRRGLVGRRARNLVAGAGFCQVFEHQREALAVHVYLDGQRLPDGDPGDRSDLAVEVRLALVERSCQPDLACGARRHGFTVQAEKSHRAFERRTGALGRILMVRPGQHV